MSIQSTLAFPMSFHDKIAFPGSVHGNLTTGLLELYHDASKYRTCSIELFQCFTLLLLALVTPCGQRLTSQ
jgi:hypothetical protein